MEAEFVPSDEYHLRSVFSWGFLAGWDDVCQEHVNVVSPQKLVQGSVAIPGASSTQLQSCLQSIGSGPFWQSLVLSSLEFSPIWCFWFHAHVCNDRQRKLSWETQLHLQTIDSLGIFLSISIKAGILSPLNGSVMTKSLHFLPRAVL